MNDPQIWTLIGVFSAIVIGGMTITTGLLSRNITGAISGLRGEMNARFEAVGARFDATDTRIDALHAEMNARFEAVDARFETVNIRIDHLDRDVAALTRRVWGEPPER